MDQHPDKKCRQTHKLHRKPTNTLFHCRDRRDKRRLDAEDDVFQLEDQILSVLDNQKHSAERTRQGDGVKKTREVSHGTILRRLTQQFD